MRLLSLMLSLLLLVGCDRADAPGDDKPVAPTDAATLDERPTAQHPLALTPDAPATQPATDAADAPPGVITVAGRDLALPPVRLLLSRDGSAQLVAEPPDGTPGNTLTLTFTPVTDGARPWRRASHTLRLTSLESESPDGLYVGAPENHLRPLELRLELARDDAEPRWATVVLTGTLIPADADDLTTARRFDISATLRVAIENP